MRSTIATVALSFISLATFGQETASQSLPHVGLPIDWSSRHVIHSMRLDKDFEQAARKDPRILFQYLQRQNARQATLAARQQGLKPKNLPVQRDWNFTLGSGTIAPNMSPAKYGYLTSSAPDCTNDFAVYGLNVAGVSTGGAGTAQPNLVGFNNLYAGSLASAVSIASASEASSTVTITTSAAHGLVVGNSVVVQGVSPAGYNGTFVVTAVSGLTFSYTNATTGLAAGSGGTSTRSGICGLTPTARFAYNVSSSSGAILTSPVISTDGAKVAFIESRLSSVAITAATEAGTTMTFTAAAHGFSTGDQVTVTGVLNAGYNETYTITGTTANTFTVTSLQSGLTASSGGTANVAKGGAVFSILTLGTTGNNGSFLSGTNVYSVSAPGGGSPVNNASMLSTSYSANGNTRSSPYIDFGHDVAYFGDDAGLVYRSSCVFFCASAPTVTALNTSFGATVKMGPPVVDSYTGQLFVGGSDGKLYGIALPQTCTAPCATASVTVGSGGTNGGIVDAPIIDSTFHTVFTESGNLTFTAVEAAQYNYALTSLATLSSGTQAYPLVSGAFNDEYYNNSLGSPTVTGSGYFCGPTGGSGQADLYTVGFTNPTVGISTTSEAGTTVTITTSAAHGLTIANVGQQVTIAGVLVAGYNGTFTITAVPSTTTFQYTAGAGLAASSSGTVARPLTTSNPPIMATGSFTATAIAGPNKATCSSMLLFTAGGTERLFFSQPNVPKNSCTGSGATTTDGCVLSYSINTSTGFATLSSTLSVLSGTSGMVIDNSSSSGQAASLYFANQALVGEAVATRCTYTALSTASYCAIKVTQNGLQ